MLLTHQLLATSSAIEFKNKIVTKVNSIEDESILQEIYQLLNFETELSKIYQLSGDEKKAIEVGLQDLKSNRIYSSQDANALLHKWLKK